VGVGSAVDLVKSLVFAVALGSVGVGLLRRHHGLLVGLMPEVGLVGRAIVGQDLFDGDPPRFELGDSLGQHGACGERLLVVVGLGVGQVGMIIDDGVNEGMPQQRLVMLVLPRRDGLTVPGTVLTTAWR